MFAAYYDKRLVGVGSEWSAWEPPEGVYLVNYSTIADWLEKHGVGDVLIFTMDVMPFSAHNRTPNSKESRIVEFIKRGGVVVWMGYTPMMYRVRCIPANAAKLDLVPNDVVNKIKVTNVGDLICYRDVNGYLYVDLTTAYVGYRRLFGPFGTDRTCELGCTIELEPSIFTVVLKREYPEYGELADVVLYSRLLYQPKTYTIPLSETEYHSPICPGDGVYFGAYAQKIGKGYFIRIADKADQRAYDFAIFLGAIFSGNFELLNYGRE